jgi:hypothetical protein
MGVKRFHAMTPKSANIGLVDPVIRGVIEEGHEHIGLPTNVTESRLV